MYFSDYDSTVSLLKRATVQPAKHIQYFDENEKVQNRLFKSLRLWSLYADIEVSQFRKLNLKIDFLLN